MIRVRLPMVSRRRMAGLSLIEMMIALVMALIVAAGIISVFTSTSSSNKVQAQMAALQEEGRFAIHSLRADLANANGGYCSNTGGGAGQSASDVYLDGVRSPIIYATDFPTINAAFADDTTPLVAPATPQEFSLPSRMYMRGYDCTTSACTPIDPNSVVSAIPPMGTAVGARVPGTAVLTIRYIRPGSGWAISPGGTTITATNGVVTSIALAQLPGEDPVSDFTGSLAMLADCSNSQVFAVGNSSGVLTPTGANDAQPTDITGKSAPRVFDFARDFQTVTYYLQVVCANNAVPCAGTTTGALVRQVNGGTANAANGGSTQVLVRGVERLDFRYGVIGSDGLTRFLTAAEVDNSGTDASGVSIGCHLVPPYMTSDVTDPGGLTDDGCLWRAVQSIEVHILMDGQTPLYTLTPAEMEYIYTPDGNVMEAPSAHAVTPSTQGFPNQLIRREFTALIVLRNFNP